MSSTSLQQSIASIIYNSIILASSSLCTEVNCINNYDKQANYINVITNIVYQEIGKLDGQVVSKIGQASNSISNNKWEGAIWITSPISNPTDNRSFSRYQSTTLSNNLKDLIKNTIYYFMLLTNYFICMNISLAKLSVFIINGDTVQFLSKLGVAINQCVKGSALDSAISTAIVDIINKQDRSQNIVVQNIVAPKVEVPQSTQILESTIVPATDITDPIDVQAPINIEQVASTDESASHIIQPEQPIKQEQTTTKTQIPSPNPLLYTGVTGGLLLFFYIIFIIGIIALFMYKYK